tara:strand:- start:129 stop:362 length:234 start_codon:yes stop_codon:yes gene_type:complete
MNRKNPQKNISRLKLKKLKEDAKYNDQMRIDRNSYLLKSERLEDDIKELEAKVLELEHELYYERRNRRISEMYSEKE